MPGRISFIFLSAIVLLLSYALYPKTKIFYENNFPASENGKISRGVLEEALASLDPLFINFNALMKDEFSDGDLLILPYGSAFPLEAWEKLNNYLIRGNILVIGGRPFTVPVRLSEKKWIAENFQNTYSAFMGIQYSYEVPLEKNVTLQWSEDAPFFHGTDLKTDRVFVNAGYGDRYRGLAYLVNPDGDRIGAPVTAEDLTGFNEPARRRVYLSFHADADFWKSEDGIELIRKAAVYASYGGVRLWLDIQQLTVEPGGFISGSVDVIQDRSNSTLKLELFRGSEVIAARSLVCGKKQHEEIGLTIPLVETGLYRLRASLSDDDIIFEQYSSGIEVRDSVLLRSGKRLETGRDYFQIDGKPVLLTGVNYFSTDLYTSGFFVGGSLGGNAWVWEKDFAEMERLGFNTVRTGIWLNRLNYLDPVTGAAGERLLRAIEAYLHSAARHNMQVIFTFFAFDPQTELQQGQGQEGNRSGPGSNPYIDPVAIEAQAAYVSAIVSRFRDVPFLSFDLINEPSFNNPDRLWRGNSPSGDPVEKAAWGNWLKDRYGIIDSLAKAWGVPSLFLGSFENVELPAFGDLELVRSGNPRTVAAVDFNRFAQDMFSNWVNSMIKAIRAAGGTQLVTVGQDEGGTADRLLNHFWTRTEAAYTSNHTWWRDDHLLWGSAAAKTPFKPNLIGETGIQPVWSPDRSWRWDEIKGFPLLERKLALGFANANAGVLYWDWTRSDPFGLLRRDGSYKKWLEPLKGIAKFASAAQIYAQDVQLPGIALVLPHSLQLSSFGSWGIEVQQKAVRALYHYARGCAYTISEYQLAEMPEVKLIIVPAPWIFSKDSWNELIKKAEAGAVVLISGRIDADEHWHSDMSRFNNWNLEYSRGLLITREAEITWPEGTAHLSYSGDKTTYAERGFLSNGNTFAEVSLGKGKILYSALPLEIADQPESIGKIYKYAMKVAGVETAYETSETDAGILIAPTKLKDATLYVLTSETSSEETFSFKDLSSGKSFTKKLAPGRAALLLIDREGYIKASYSQADVERLD